MIRPDVFETLVRQAVGMSGTYDPDRCLYMVEERMTGDEYNLAESFLRWCFVYDKQFGSATFQERLAEYRSEVDA